MEFEQVVVEEPPEASVLRDVSISYAVDHYRNLVMSRYPSELDDLMRSVMPHSKRCVNKEKHHEGNGALLLYHYLLHGFRSNSLKIANLIESEDERIHTHRVWLTYLQCPAEEIDVCSYDEFPTRAHRNKYDAVFFNHYDQKESSDANIENVFRYILFTLNMLKPYGFVTIEGVSHNHIHHLQTVIGILYMYPELCQIHVINPFISSDKSTFTVIVRRMFEDYNIPDSCIPLYAPIPARTIPGHPLTLVLVTSAYKSANNSNIVPERTRWRQLLHSIRTVRQKICNAYVVVTDVSQLSETQLSDLRTNGVDEVRVFPDLEGVAKSYCEAIVMHRVYEDILTRVDNPFLYAVKLSGRYFLTHRFSFQHTNEVVCKRMRPQEVMTRYIQIPRKLFEKYLSVLKTISEMPTVVKAEMDIEHALGCTFPEMDEAGARTRKIDVAGFYATNGQMLVE